MKTARTLRLVRGTLMFIAILAIMTVSSSCDQDDPKPVNEEELITTVEIVLSPVGGGDIVTLKFFDADGDVGSIAPLVTVSGNLKASTTYHAEIALRNETVNPPVDITEEILEEAGEHLFCFASDGSISVQYLDEDTEGMPIGLSTSWQIGDAGPAQMTISLRHQAGTKTGQCPGSGETDIEVTFNMEII